MKFHGFDTHKGQIEENGDELTMKEVEQHYKKNGKYLYEYIEASHLVKPFFDVDLKFFKDGSLKGELDECHFHHHDYDVMFETYSTNYIDFLDKTFNKKCTYAIDNASGWQTDEKKGEYYKLSMHLIIQDFKVNVGDLKLLLEQKDPEKGFDHSVYNLGVRKFRVGGFDPIGSKRKSKIIRGNVIDFIVQDVEHIREFRDLKTEFNLKSEPQTKKSKNTNIKKTTNIIMDKNIKIEDLKNYSEIKDLLKMIGAIDDYGDWFKVSCIIKNTDERFYPLWVEWCKLSNQYNENVNDNIWAGLAVNGGLKMGSLHHIARSKNPDEYFKQNYFEIVDQWWDQDELGIANIYASLFNN